MLAEVFLEEDGGYAVQTVLRGIMPARKRGRRSSRIRGIEVLRESRRTFSDCGHPF